MDSPVIWTIAGSDPSVHAGAYSDIAVIRSLGAEPCAVITALTAQNKKGVRAVQAVDPEFLREELETLIEERRPQALKLGMLPNAAAVQVLSDFAEAHGLRYILDPVMASSSEAELIDSEGIAAMRRSLLPYTALITPNLPEAEQLTQEQIPSRDTYPAAAAKLLELGAAAVLIKDGHGEGRDCLDYFSDGKQSFWLQHPRFPGEYRGTGCLLSSAIATAYGRLGSLSEAAIQGTAYASRAIRFAGERLQLAPWPVSAEDFPRIPHGSTPQTAFPEIEREALGFYPIAPNAQWVERLVGWGAKMLQLRVKELSGDALEQEIIKALELCTAAGCKLFVNDYWELAAKHQAYGVHLGQEDLQTVDLEALAQSGLRLGISTHSYEELARALAYQPSYIALGPIYATQSKPMAFAPQGLERISEWQELSSVPLVAIGGLGPERALSCLQAGAHAVACISDITEAKDPQARSQEWLKLF